MAVLPTSDIDISSVQFQSQPSLTWYIDQTSQRISGEVTGLQAVAQAVAIILNTERFRWQIYQPYSGMQWDGLIGQNPGYVASELQRRIAEALTVDDRITGISDFSYSFTGNSLTASFTVNSVYGDTAGSVEVTMA